MAGGEDEPQEVVVERIVGRGRKVVVHRRAELRVAAELLDLALMDLRAAKPVDPPMLGRGHEPRARVVRDARLRPLLQRGNQRLLSEVLCEPDVAHQAGDARDQPRRLDPPDGLDGPRDVGTRHGRAHAPPSVCARSRASLSRSSGVNSSPKSSDSATRRISTTASSPSGFGIRFTHSTASSIDLTSQTQ